MDMQLQVAVIFAVGLHCSSVRGLDSNLDTGYGNVQNVICDTHNKCRRNADPSASDMQKLVWNKEAAANAKRVADKCIFEHSSEAERKISTCVCGENLASTTRSMLWDKVIPLWDNEKYDFKYAIGPTPNKQYLHYTQLVWGNTYGIGCACKECSGFHLYVCHYACMGNTVGKLNTPYTEGTPCGKCPNNCENGLCTNPCLYKDKASNCKELSYACDSGMLGDKCDETCKCG
ncbi:cysteine-rich secretory protein 2-like [Lissotriton helveticus]